MVGTASGTITAPGTLCYGLTIKNTDRPIAAHIHRGRKHENGPIVIPLTPPNGGNPGHSSACVSGIDPALLVGLRRAFRDEEGALPVIAAVDHHEQSSAFHIAAKCADFAPGFGDAEPEDVHRRPEGPERQRRFLAQHRAAPVRGDDEIRSDLNDTFGAQLLLLDVQRHKSEAISRREPSARTTSLSLLSIHSASPLIIASKRLRIASRSSSGIASSYQSRPTSSAASK